MSEGLDTSAGSHESRAEAARTEPSAVRLWLQAIDTATAEEKDWREAAEHAAKAYAGQRDSGQREFNIFHANVETIVPALYNSTPAPDVRRRYADKDEAGKEVADTLERALSYSVDAYDFDAVMTAAVKDMQVPGRGIVRVRYIPYLGQDGESVAYQEVRCEHVPWQHFRHGPANTWSEIPWIAFEHFLDRDEITKLVGSEEAAKLVPLNYSSTKGSKDETDKDRNSVFRRAKVWEIWDRTTKRVLFICPDYTEKELKVEDDPLGLDGFFPIPRPLQAIWQTDKLVPVTPLSVYEDLVSELNEITRRISRMMKVMKAKGGYPANIADDLAKIAEADDGELVPYGSNDLLQFTSGGATLDKMIIWWPIETIIAVLKELFVQREATKQAIYEVTGIADVLRGSTDPDETLGAQQLKAQWGSVRIQRQQGEVQRFAADLFNLKAEIFATHFEPQVLSIMTGINLGPEAVQLMRGDKLRSYRVDVESDSTIRGDLQRNQETMALFLQGTAQYVSAVQPLVMSSPGALPAVIGLYAAFARQFKLGKSAEDELEKLVQASQQPQQQGPDPAMAEVEGKLKIEQEKAQGQLGIEKAKMEGQLAIEGEKMKMQAGLEQQKMLGQQKMAETEMAQRGNIEQEKFKREGVQADREFGLKRAAQNQQIMADMTAPQGGEAGPAPPSEGVTAIEQMANAITQLASSVAQMAQANQQALAAVSAPKQTRIVRDGAGRAIGAETVAATIN